MAVLTPPSLYHTHMHERTPLRFSRSRTKGKIKMKQIKVWLFKTQSKYQNRHVHKVIKVIFSQWAAMNPYGTQATWSAPWATGENIKIAYPRDALARSHSVGFFIISFVTQIKHSLYSLGKKTPSSFTELMNQNGTVACPSSRGQHSVRH